MMNSRNLFVLVLILIAAGLRLSGILPYNFTPIAAIALFGGAMFQNRGLAFLIPFSILLLTDLVIGFHDTMWAVYGAFLLIVLIGHFIRKNPTMLSAMGGALTGSVLFFLITNAAAWLSIAEYSKDLSGLMNCYAAGIPFFRGTLVGDLLFTAVMFGSFKLAELRFPKWVKA